MRRRNSALFIAATICIIVDTVLSLLVLAEFLRQNAYEEKYLSDNGAETQLIGFAVSIPHLYSFTFVYSAYSLRSRKKLLFYGFNTPILLSLNLLFASALKSSLSTVSPLHQKLLLLIMGVGSSYFIVSLAMLLLFSYRYYCGR